MSLRDHVWVNVSFLHIKMVCKFCDVEKEKTESLYCKYVATLDEITETDYPGGNMWDSITW